MSMDSYNKSNSPPEPPGTLSRVIVILAHAVAILAFPFTIWGAIKCVNEYERADIFRLGRLQSGGAKGPGVFIINPFIDEFTVVDNRTNTRTVQPQTLLTKDHVTVEVDAVVYFRVTNAVDVVTKVKGYMNAILLLASSVLRNNLSTRDLKQVLSEREAISKEMEGQLDEATNPWGVMVERVEVKDVKLPSSMIRAMAVEAEATREAKAKVIMAQGEVDAADALKKAADEFAKSFPTMQLRYLQTASNIAMEKKSTIVFPVPVTLEMKE